MKNMFIYILLIFTLVACKDEPVKENQDVDKSENELSMEELIKRKITADLEIPATENYTLEIHRKHLNPDEFEDAVILVNRKEYVIEKSKKMNRSVQDAKLGFFGSNNHMFFYDGMTHTVTKPIAIASSALIPLKINFHNIHTEAHSDFTLDTRVQESRWRNFYTVKKGIPRLVFQWNVQDYNEENVMITNHFVFDKGTYSLAKDILIYEADLLSDTPSDLMSDFDLKTKPKGEILYRFFYNPNEGKYFTAK